MTGWGGKKWGTWRRVGGGVCRLVELLVDRSWKLEGDDAQGSETCSSCICVTVLMFFGQVMRSAGRGKHAHRQGGDSFVFSSTHLWQESGVSHQGRSPGKSKGKGKSPSLPRPLQNKGFTGRTPQGLSVCFDYNLAHGCTCPGDCPRGAHVCIKCFGRHSLINCTSR